MRCTNSARPGLAVRLGYGLNLYPSRDARGVLAGLREIAVPLRARLATEAGAGPFGVGAWLPGLAAREFLSDARLLDELVGLCGEAGLDPFTFNAFPHGAFHGPGLKQRVFEPTWKERERLDFTLDVARIAVHLATRAGADETRHLSISTHAGMFAPAMGPGDREAVVDGFVAAARALAELESESGRRVLLSLEPEPRSTANDTRELEELLQLVRARAQGPAEEAVHRHLGACLDTCHAAVEFEAPCEAFQRATAHQTPLGKLQFSSALALVDPGAAREGRARLLALDEPVYLHQLTARRGSELLRAVDLRALAPDDPAWLAADEWRCHFHVPVDLGAFDSGLATTRGEADQTLDAALAAPERWGTSELHVEVETYTWNLFQPGQTGADSLLEGLERELRHVLARLSLAGWHSLR